ncbi:MAG: GIY-YIG nuclease family protein [Polyangiaceae bacterium]
MRKFHVKHQRSISRISPESFTDSCTAGLGVASIHRVTGGDPIRCCRGHSERMPFMYILECSDRSTYVGSTWNLDRRVEQHNMGEGAEYTKTRRPVRLLYFEEYARIAQAFAREKQVQGWGRAKRLALVHAQPERLPELSKKSNWEHRDECS